MDKSDGQEVDGGVVNMLGLKEFAPLLAEANGLVWPCSLKGRRQCAEIVEVDVKGTR